MARILKVILFIFIPAILLLSGCDPSPPEAVKVTSVTWVSGNEPMQCDKEGKIIAKVSLEIGTSDQQTIQLRLSMWDEELDLGEAKNRPVLESDPGRVTKIDLEEEIPVWCSRAPDCWFEGEYVSTMKQSANPYIKVTWAENDAVIDGWEKNPKPFNCVATTGGGTTTTGVDKPEPVGVIIAGQLYKDTNANGVKDALEEAMTQVSVRAMDLACEGDCEPVAEDETNEEGKFELKISDPETNLGLDVDHDDWEDLARILYSGQPFSEQVGDASPGDTVTLPPIGFVQREMTFPDDWGDTVIAGSDDPMDNPAGDIEHAVVGVNPDGTVSIQIQFANDEAEGAYSTGMFVNESWMGTIRTMTWHRFDGRVDKGKMEGGSGGYPNIVESDVEAEFGSFTSPLETVPQTEAELEQHMLEYGIEMYNRFSEGDDMSADEMTITPEQLNYVLWWLRYYWFPR